MKPEQYLAYVRKRGSRIASALGALDKLNEYARHFEKAFLKGRTAATSLSLGSGLVSCVGASRCKEQDLNPLA
jgi:hypothetical protein